MKFMAGVLCALLLGLGACVEVVETEPAPEGIDQQAHGLDVFKSLAILDRKILQPFTFKRVLDQLVAQSGIPGMTSLQLFNQWWDTQNPGPSLGLGSNCDDQPGFPGLNEFPWECPRAEGHQAFDPFELPNDPLYIPVGLFNRFDLAPSNGAHCGEYRIVFAMAPGHPLAQGNGRNFVIFEAILPNPNPALGLAGCMPVAQFWEDLSSLSMSTRRAHLEKFYFHGLGGGFAPVVHVNHYGLMLGANGYGCSTGQIRTNQFEQGPWTMREYKLVKDCRCSLDDCKLLMVPMTVKTNPHGEMFNVASVEPRVPALVSAVASQVGSLSIPDINKFSYEVSDILNAAESPIDDPAQVNNYLLQFSSPFNAPFDAAISASLPPGSTLSPSDIVARAQALSCAGCHRQSNSANLGDGVIWPDSLGFTHVDEFVDPITDRYHVSNAMISDFLPFREALLDDFLQNGPPAGGATRCSIQMPPELSMSPAECKKATKDPSVLKFPSSAIRMMRERWEGGRILGRRAGH